MRRGFYLVLMVVLVLRGLTGTAMAAGVLAPLHPGVAPSLAVQSHAGHGAGPAEVRADAGHHTAHSFADGQVPHGIPAADAAPDPSTHAVAAEIAVTPPGDGDLAGCAGDDHHATACSACDICHAAMLEALIATTPAHRALGGALPTASAAFHSASAALAIKPPIG
ncbi:MAG: hypothetical protein EON50_12410 [Acidovorax sp.]|nr:MAG: hypothetical protein EON50_12410 [Acidovorax sp.]